jgi:hypothetical protein
LEACVVTSLIHVLFLDAFGKMQGWNSTGTQPTQKDLVLWMEDRKIHCCQQLILAGGFQDNSIRLLARYLQRCEQARKDAAETRWFKVFTNLLHVPEDRYLMTDEGLREFYEARRGRHSESEITLSLAYKSDDGSFTRV